MSLSDDDGDCYGPALPPSLRHSNDVSFPDSSEKEKPCRPAIGPQLPPTLTYNQSSDEDEDGTYGPVLPPSKSDEKSGVRTDSTSPCGYTSSQPDNEEEDDDIIGPMPASGDSSSDISASKRSDLERRAALMKEKLHEQKYGAPHAREQWMLELPADRAKEFGLGPRQFLRSAAPERGDTSMWTDTPADRLKKKSDHNKQQKPQSDVSGGALCDTTSRRRDERISAIVEESASRRDSRSLLETHTEQRRKLKQEKGECSKKRREFDRDLDLGVNRFDDAQKNAAINRSRGVCDRFASGSRRYL